MFATCGRKILFGTLLAVAVASAGCEKEVKVTFLNTTSHSRDLELVAPGHGTILLGTIGATGGQVTYKLKIDEDYLPATCTYQAGDRSGSFTITKESEGKMRIIFDPTGDIGPIDTKTEVHKTDKIEVQEVIVEQETVVE